MNLLPARRAWPLAAVVLIAAVYAPTLDDGFQFDDAQTIVHNPALQAPVSWALLTDPASFSRTPGAAMFRPGVLLTYAANQLVAGSPPWSWHGFNVAVHAAVTLLLFSFTRQLGGGVAAAGLAACLFGLHPLAVEPTAYISARAETLATLAILGALVLHARVRRIPGGGLRAWGAPLVTAAGLMCKATAAMAAPLLVTWELLVMRAPVRRALLAAAPVMAVTAAYLLLVRGFVHEALVASPVRGLAAQLATQAKALAYYARLVVLPHPLSVEHPVGVAQGVEPAWLAAAVLVVSLSWCAWAAGRRGWRRTSFLLCWPGWVLLPTVVVPLNLVVAERRLYPALAALCPLVVLLARRAPVPRRAVALAGALLLLLLSLERTSVWATERSLWEDAARISISPRPQVRLGMLAREAGDLAAAEAHLRAALRLDGDHAPVWNNLGNVQAQAGDLAAAEASYARALELLPSYPEALTNLAALRVRQGHLEEARALYLRAVALQPRHAGMRNNLGTLYLRLHEPGRAEEELRQALRLGDRSAGVWFNLSGALEGQGRNGEALAALEAAVAADPEYAPARLHMGHLLAAAGRVAEARDAYAAFLRLWRGDPETAAHVRRRLAALSEAGS